MYRVIMAPSAGSEFERSAISVAVKLAQRFEADLRLVRVDPAPAMADSIPAIQLLASTQQLLLEEGVVSEPELDARAATIANEWAHDHDH